MSQNGKKRSWLPSSFHCFFFFIIQHESDTFLLLCNRNASCPFFIIFSLTTLQIAEGGGSGLHCAHAPSTFLNVRGVRAQRAIRRPPTTSFSSLYINSTRESVRLTSIAPIERAYSDCALWEHRGRSDRRSRPLPHHRRPVMMDQVPSTLHPLIEIRRENLTLLSGLALMTGDIFHADDPGEVSGHLHQDIRQLKFH